MLYMLQVKIKFISNFLIQVNSQFFFVSLSPDYSWNRAKKYILTLMSA